MKQVGVILAIAMVTLWSLSGCDSNAGNNQTSDTEETSTDVAATDMNPTDVAAVEENAAANASLPAFEFEETTHDFGTITEGEVVEHVFKFKNTGEAPLVIQSTSASCGCTTPNYSREPVPPGETGEVQVRFNSRNQVGMKNKTVTITANTDPAVTRLAIKMSVLPENDGVAGPVRK